MLATRVLLNCTVVALDNDPTQSPGEAAPSPVAPVSDESREWMGNLRAGVKARLFDEPEDTWAADGELLPRPVPVGPTRIGRYIVIKRIGAGGMGVVYAAYDDKLDRKVAVKLLRPGFGSVTRTARQRLLREAQAIARLSHRSVIQIYEVGTHEDEVFLAMEYVEGSTLKQWQPSRDWREILELYRDAGRGLCAAHAASIVHRDFKADNVLVRVSDHAVRVVDFGLARTDGQPDLGIDPQAPLEAIEPSLTHTGVIMGTPAYMAPEQHLARATDPRTDQYAFCSSLFEALYGYRAFSGERLEELRANVLEGIVEAAPRYTTVPPRIHRALTRGLSVDPDARFATMEALLVALELPNPAKPWRRAAWGAGLFSLALGGSMLWSNTSTDSLSPEGIRIRAEFDSKREPDLQDELKRHQTRTIPQRWNDLVLAHAAASTSPTTRLAVLKHLSMSDTQWLAAARASAAEALRHGPIFAVRATAAPVRRVVFSPGSSEFAALTEAGSVSRWTRPEDPAPKTTSFEAQPIDMALTPDGHLQVILTGGLLSTLGPASNTPVTRQIHEGALTGIATDKTGQIAIGAEDGTVFVLHENATTVLREHVATLSALAFDPRKNTLASGDTSGHVTLWFLDRKTHRAMGIDRAIRQLSWFSEEGVVVARTSGGSAAWDATKGTQAKSPLPSDIHKLARAQDAPVQLAVGPQGTRATLEDGTAFALESQENAADLAVSRDGRWGAAAGTSGVTLWRTGPDDTGARPPGDHQIDLAIEGEVVGVHARADSIVAVTSGGVVFESPVGHHVHRTAELALAIHTTSASEDQRRLALATQDGALHILDLDDPGALLTLGTAEQPGLGPVRWSRDGSTVAQLSCPSDTTICSLTAHDSDGSGSRSLADNSVRAGPLHVSPTGDRVAIAYEASVSAWDTRAGARARFRAPNGGRVLAVAFHESGELRIAAMTLSSGGPALEVGRVDEEGTMHTLFEEDGLRRVFATADGTGVVLETTNGRALLWQLSEDRFVPVPADALLGSAAPEFHLAPDGRRAWVGQPMATEVTLLDLETGLRALLPRPVGPVAWPEGGNWVDVRRLRTLRRWGAAAPRTPQDFADWLQTRTQVEIPLEALQSTMPERDERL